MAKRTNSQAPALDTEELELDPELETQPEPVEEEVQEDDPETDTDEVEEELEPAPPQHSEEMVPLSRVSAEKARADTLLQVLEQLRQPQQAAPVQNLPDPDANLSAQDKQWKKYILGLAEPEIERRVSEKLQQTVTPLQRDSVVVKDMLDEMKVRKEYTDYHLYENDVNVLRHEWYRDMGVIAPRYVAYAVAKMRKEQANAGAKRTQQVRAAAKPGATVPNKTTARKVTPSGPLTLNDIATLSDDALDKLVGTIKF